MKDKLFWTFFLVYLFSIAAIFSVDRFYLFRQAEVNIKNDLEVMATALIASKLSVDTFNSFEDTDDVIHDLLQNQRLDRTIRVFTTQKDLIFFNELARQLTDEPSSAHWSEFTISNRHLKRLTISTKGYILEVGLFIDPMLSDIRTQTNQILIILFIILIAGIIISYFATKSAMQPLNQLADFFNNHSKKNKKQTSILLHQDRMFLTSLMHSNDEISTMSKSFISLIDNVQIEQDKKEKDLYFLAHELKTPLAQLIFGLEDQIKTTKDMQNKEKLDRLFHICRNLSEFIKNYLRIASLRIQTKSDLQLSAVNAEYLLKSVLETFSENEKSRIQILNMSSLIIITEIQFFESIVQNLMTNALKYSTQEITIEINNNTICFIDSGLGFSESTLKNIGQPFNKSNLNESTGLGLAYCYEICNLLNWKLTHERQEDKTTMRLIFDNESLVN